MSFLEKYAWFRFAFCLVALALQSFLMLSPGGAGTSWEPAQLIITVFVCGYLLVGGSVGLHGRRQPRHIEDERDIAIARRARSAALFALCSAAYLLAMVLAEREWPSDAVSRIVVAQWILTMLPLALSVEAGISAVLYWLDRRGAAGAIDR